MGRSGETSFEKSAPDDNDLLADIAAGSHGAFRLLIERYRRPMLTLALRTVGNAADAEEIVQEVFLKVWIAAPRWDTSGDAKFSTWLFRVALNLCIDHRRRRPVCSLEDIEEPIDPAPGGLAGAEARQRHDMLLLAMSSLPKRQHAALSLYYFWDEGALRTAEILGLSVPAFQSLLLRGRRSLKKELLRRGFAGIGDIL